MRFRTTVEEGGKSVLPFPLPDYIELVGWTGKVHRDDKRGRIDPRLPVTMQRLNLDPEVWRNAMRSGGNVFGRAMGQLDRLRLHAASLDQLQDRSRRVNASRPSSVRRRPAPDN